MSDIKDPNQQPCTLFMDLKLNIVKWYWENWENCIDNMQGEKRN